MLALKLHGPQTAAALGKRLTITGEAVRQQLVRLAEDGFVLSWSEAKGVGRPSQFWGLTALGHAEFPDTHAELTVQLLRTIRQTLGEAAIDRLIAARENETRENYSAAMSDKKSLRERVDELVRLRSQEGYMAAYEDPGDGTLLFVENHCPICAAATSCQGFCRAELSVFRAVLGPGVEVERAEHILAGARRCAYVVRMVDQAA
ncbi:transcriptional regulator [Ensifer sp. ENS10]|uniref:helix-turn-helix transcriptional regulator n=1 Tax=unclassified Ensifer TaxID=2633371 RepID=UPI0009EAF91C|nr:MULTISPECIES: metalloregulator ArsR/SmtB family transcription factor [unclassified Ensifer]MBD9508313.1 transcriptional regulator [Ensifer sp. ENS10]MBV7518295.1 transcriptional regulator [Ensifer sp. ENS12]